MLCGRFTLCLTFTLCDRNPEVRWEELRIGRGAETGKCLCTRAASTTSSKATCRGADLPDSQVPTQEQPPHSPPHTHTTVRPTEKQILPQEQKVNLAAKLHRQSSPQPSVTVNVLRGINTAASGSVDRGLCVCGCVRVPLAS